jgi:hypothetical protein
MILSGARTTLSVNSLGAAVRNKKSLAIAWQMTSISTTALRKMMPTFNYSNNLDNYSLRSKSKNKI